MSWVPIAAAVVSTVLSVKGSQDAAKASQRVGAQEQASDQYAGAQARVNAGQAQAAGQRSAFEQRRQGELLQSRAIALAASGGGGVTDPGLITLLSRNAGETAYRSAVALYQGDDEARADNTKADALEYSGSTALQAGNDRASAYRTKAFGDLIGGASSLYSRFGGGGYAQQSPAPVFNANPRAVS